MCSLVYDERPLIERPKRTSVFWTRGIRNASNRTLYVNLVEAALVIYAEYMVKPPDS